MVLHSCVRMDIMDFTSVGTDQSTAAPPGLLRKGSMPPCFTDLFAFNERRVPTEEQRWPIPGVDRRSFLKPESEARGGTESPRSRAIAETEPVDADFTMPCAGGMPLDEVGLEGGACGLSAPSSKESMRYSWVLPMASNIAVMLDLRTGPRPGPSQPESSSRWKVKGSFMRRPAAGEPAITQGRPDLGEVAGGSGSTGSASVGTRTTPPMMRRLARPLLPVGEDGRLDATSTAAGFTSTACSANRGWTVAPCTLNAGGMSQVPTDGQRWNGADWTSGAGDSAAAFSWRFCTISSMAFWKSPVSKVRSKADLAFSRMCSRLAAFAGCFCCWSTAARRPLLAAARRRSRASRRRVSTRASSRAVRKLPSFAARSIVSRASMRSFSTSSS
mmetsp:Transcript_24440/g.56652  ORF Transcript_24440/g.56652 Transcript_24440/m.56652 type:complete len:387 (-) Transcript_24440:1085-2245(-)